MIYHVLPGDAQVEAFKRTGIAGELIVCREALVSGPIDAENLESFWHERAAFILSEYGEDEIEYHDKVAGELSKLCDMTVDDEVNLWFEYELFCSVNLWFCLALLSATDATVFRVEPSGLAEKDRWNGFATFDPPALIASFEHRTELTPRDVKLGAAFWDAYRHKDHGELKRLAGNETIAFPHVVEVVAAAAEQETRPAQILREIAAVGEKDFGKIFREFKKRAGVYGYGDLQVEALLNRL